MHHIISKNLNVNFLTSLLVAHSPDWNKRLPKMSVSPGRNGVLIFMLGILMLLVEVQNQASDSNQAHRRFEYKYSFKPPYLAQKDGTVPFFEYSGSKCDNLA